MSIWGIIAAIIIFGFLIFIHESGHFLCARLFKVKINEFALGMGPKILTKKSKKSGIAYSLRLFPIGGFVSMAGEDEESEDPDAFTNKPVWQRMIITAAGGIVNLVFGVLVMSIIVMSSPLLGSNTVAQFDESAVSEASGLMQNDEIVKVDGKKVYISNQVTYEILHSAMREENVTETADGTKQLSLDLTVIRDGVETELNDVVFPTGVSEGVLFGDIDFKLYAEEKTFTNVMKQAYFQSTSTIKMIWDSLGDLVMGRYGIEAVSGPVGVTEALSSAASTGFRNLVYLAVVISMNLGIMNLLPLPALDGGRLFFQLIELVFRKPVKRSVEGFVHFAGIVVLMVFMLLITVKDVVGLF